MGGQRGKTGGSEGVWAGRWAPLREVPGGGADTSTFATCSHRVAIITWVLDPRPTQVRMKLAAWGRGSLLYPDSPTAPLGWSGCAPGLRTGQRPGEVRLAWRTEWGFTGAPVSGPWHHPPGAPVEAPRRPGCCRPGTVGRPRSPRPSAAHPARSRCAAWRPHRPCCGPRRCRPPSPRPSGPSAPGSCRPGRTCPGAGEPGAGA